MVIRQLSVYPPSTIILGSCAALAPLDIVLAVYLLRNMGSTWSLPRTTSPSPGGADWARSPPPQQIIRRAAGSILSFGMAANGPAGSGHTGYVLKLRDNATGQEVQRERSAAARSSRPTRRKDGRSADRPEPQFPWGRHPPGRVRPTPVPADSRGATG